MYLKRNQAITERSPCQIGPLPDPKLGKPFYKDRLSAHDNQSVGLVLKNILNIWYND